MRAALVPWLVLATSAAGCSWLLDPAPFRHDAHIADSEPRDASAHEDATLDDLGSSPDGASDAAEPADGGSGDDSGLDAESSDAETHADIGAPDSGAIADSGGATHDSGAMHDSGASQDSGAILDTGIRDSGASDSGANPDSGIRDSGLVDSGPPPPPVIIGTAPSVDEGSGTSAPAFPLVLTGSNLVPPITVTSLSAHLMVAGAPVVNAAGTMLAIPISVAPIGTLAEGGAEQASLHIIARGGAIDTPITIVGHDELTLTAPSAPATANLRPLYSAITINGSGLVRLTGVTGTAVRLRSAGDVHVTSHLGADGATDGTAGAGGCSGGGSNSPGGCGAFGGGHGANGGGGGGGGGGASVSGGNGSSGQGGAPDTTCNALLTALNACGGNGGGGGGSFLAFGGGNGGGGGGALELSAAGQLVLTGAISASGGAGGSGNTGSGDGGGGSGGALVIQAGGGIVQASGTPISAGGAALIGNGGSGAAGWVRMDVPDSASWTLVASGPTQAHGPMWSGSTPVIATTASVPVEITAAPGSYTITIDGVAAPMWSQTMDRTAGTIMLGAGIRTVCVYVQNINAATEAKNCRPIAAVY